MRLATGATALALGALALAGCGSSGTNADPARVTPASAPLYVSVTLKPNGGSSGDAASAARKLTHLSDPFASLAQALLSSQTSHPDFKRDIQPWIGQRAGVFLTSLDASRLPPSELSGQALVQAALASASVGAFASGTAQGAIVMDTSDSSRARSFLDGWARTQQAHPASYRGVAYRVTTGGAAEGLVKSFAVIGSEAALKTVIDTSLGAPALSMASGYRKPSSRAIATAFLAPQQLGRVVRGAGSGTLLASRLLAGARTASLTVAPTSSSLILEGEARYPSGSTPLFNQGGAEALGALPGGAWLAGGVGNAGASLGRALELLRVSGSLGASSIFASLGGASVEGLLARLSSPAAGLRRDFASWAGPAGVFVSGTGLFNLQAALVIDSRDPVASRAAVGKLANVLRQGGASVESVAIAGTDAAASVKLTGFPAVLYIADGQGKFIAGLGQASILGALHPTSTLSSSPSYNVAAQALGGGLKPSLIVEFPTLLGFLEGIGLTQNPPLEGLVPYLKSLGTLTAGATSQNGIMHFRAVLGLASDGQGG